MENKKAQPGPRVVDLFSRTRAGSGGYKSGRSSVLDTPVNFSTVNTRSGGTRPLEIQLAIAPCDRYPSNRANAVCPPTASHARNIADLAMRRITTRNGDSVNTVSVDPRAKNGRMTTKRPTYEPSDFWVRLEDAIGRFYQPFNANALAAKLGMRQSAVNKWYLGKGKPSLELALEFARKGNVHVEWLLNGVKPKHPISKDPLLRELFELCEQLNPNGDARAQILRMARNELLAQTELERQEAERLKQRRA